MRHGAPGYRVDAAQRGRGDAAARGVRPVPVPVPVPVPPSGSGIGNGNGNGNGNGRFGSVNAHAEDGGGQTGDGGPDRVLALGGEDGCRLEFAWGRLQSSGGSIVHQRSPSCLVSGRFHAAT